MTNVAPVPGEAALADEIANPTPDLDRLMDAGGLSHAEARQRLGLAATEDQVQLQLQPAVAPVTSREAARERDHEYYSREFGLSGSAAASSAQQVINNRGLEKVRTALQTARETRRIS